MTISNQFYFAPSNDIINLYPTYICIKYLVPISSYPVTTREFLTSGAVPGELAGGQGRIRRETLKSYNYKGSLYIDFKSMVDVKKSLKDVALSKLTALHRSSTEWLRLGRCSGFSDPHRQPGCHNCGLRTSDQTWTHRHRGVLFCLFGLVKYTEMSQFHNYTDPAMVVVKQSPVSATLHWGVLLSKSPQSSELFSPLITLQS